MTSICEKKVNKCLYRISPFHKKRGRPENQDPLPQWDPSRTIEKLENQDPVPWCDLDGTLEKLENQHRELIIAGP